jgi:hypothetical protein
MRTSIVATGLTLMAVWPCQCMAQRVDDSFSDYLQRSVTISMGAGNDQDANAAIHTITPWPPLVGDRRIIVDGRRAVDSVERMYRVPNPFDHQSSEGGIGSGTSSGTSSNSVGLTGAPVTPMQPISGAY